MTKPDQPWFIRRPTPDDVQKIHLLGMAGSGMGAFACMLREAGFEVRGSDRAAYPPMSDILAAREIPLGLGWDPSHLDWGPDWVIVGNVCRRDNVEAVAAEERGIPTASFPQALSDLFLAQRRPIVIAGTHGKTTTTALCAWLLSATDTKETPRTGFLVGGQGGNFEGPFRIGDAEGAFVIEGDEYDTAFFDKGPKFLHYRPEVALLNNVEFDHADIYDSIEEIEENFERLCDLITPGKSLWVNCDDARALRISERASGDVITYGFAEEAQWRALDVTPNERGCAFTLRTPDGVERRVQSPLAGRHNVWNTLAALGMAHVHFERELDVLFEALADFKGVQKRQEELGELDGVLIMDDYAHHPTAIYETLEALKARYPTRRLWALYEPKSNTARRNIHQSDYIDAFASAPRVRITRPFKKEDRFAPEERLDLNMVVEALSARGVDAAVALEIDDLIDELAREARAGDLIVFMSSSSFEGAQSRLLERLRARESVGYAPDDGSHEAYAAERAQRREQRYRALSERLDAQIGRIAAARFLAFLTLGASLISGSVDRAWSIYGWSALIGACAFIVAVWAHRRLYALAPRAQARAEIAGERAARLRHEWSRISEGGERFARGVPEERELQIFGQVSLFKLINRAHLRGAQAWLARQLSRSSSPNPIDLEELTARREAARELSRASGLRSRLLTATRVSQPKRDARAQALGLHAFAEWGARDALSVAEITRLKRLAWLGAALASATLIQGILSATLELETVWELTLLAQLALYALTTGTLNRQYLPLISEAHKPLQGLASCYELVEARTFTSPWLKRWSRELNHAGAPSARIARIARHAEALAVRHSALLYGVLSIGLMWELWHGARAAEWRARFGAEVARDLDALYRLEGLISLGDFAAERPHYSWAEHRALASDMSNSDSNRDQNSGAQAPFLSATQIAHPLFNSVGRVPNDFTITDASQLYLITGSNMSGKSSFMRALASNVTLALTGAPVCARALSCPPLVIASSIQVTDDPSQGWSRFYAEVRRICAVIERAEDASAERPTLFLIDEMLSGTNSRERRLASRAIATRLLAAPYAAGVITTHDLDLAALTERFPKQLHLRHFSDHFDGDRLLFDYTLKQGVARTTNALLVLALEGIDVRESEEA